MPRADEVEIAIVAERPEPVAGYRGPDTVVDRVPPGQCRHGSILVPGDGRSPDQLRERSAGSPTPVDSKPPSTEMS